MKPFNYAKHRITECGLDFTVKTATRLFVEENSGSLLVRDDEGGYVGMLTDKVIFRAVADGIDLLDKTLADIDLEPIVKIGKNADLDEVMEKFNESGSGRIVMVDINNRVVGVLKRKNIERFSVFRVARSLVRQDLG